jgi:hypothetical protein
MKRFKGITAEGRFAAAYFDLPVQNGDGVGRGVCYRVTTEDIFVEENPLDVVCLGGGKAFQVLEGDILDATPACKEGLRHVRRQVEDRLRKGTGKELHDIELLLTYPRTWAIKNIE